MTTTMARQTDTELPVSREQLQCEIRTVLRALADLDVRHRRDRDDLERWMGPEGAKKFIATISARQQGERQALVLRLADLHERMAELAMLGRWRDGSDRRQVACD